jgi:hypothetical protein
VTVQLCLFETRPHPRQRCDRRPRRFVPPPDTIRTVDFEVVPTRSYKPGRRFVEEQHYSGTWPQCSRAVELRGRGGRLMGVAAFSVVSRLFSAPFAEAGAWLTLARFVLLDEVAWNGETWMLGRCFELLRREGFAGIVSFSDPVPRTNARGTVVFGGHAGTIYRAHNGVFTGRSKPETRWVLPDGTLFETRTANKLKVGDEGASGAHRLLVRHGATPLQAGEDPRGWVELWRAKLCRPLKHTGNLRYLWALAKRDRRFLPPGLPYHHPPLACTGAMACQ